MNPAQAHSSTRLLICVCALVFAASCDKARETKEAMGTKDAMETKETMETKEATPAVCKECGTVAEIKTIRLEGDSSGVGAVAGGVLGGVLGHQVGGGTGKDLATIGGVVGGAYVGNKVEKKSNERFQYRVRVEMEDGTSRTFKYSSPTSFQVGDSVKVKNDMLVRP